MTETDRIDHAGLKSTESGGDRNTRSPVIHLPMDRPLLYCMTGKFSAPSPEWIHMDMDLSDYELIVMTRGSLYIEYNGTPFTVTEGEYLILPPVEGIQNRRRGLRPSDCEFYWLHFLPADGRLYPKIPGEGDASPGGEEPILHIPMWGTVPGFDKLVVLMRQLQTNVRAGHPMPAIRYETSLVLCELAAQTEAPGESGETAEPPAEHGMQVHIDIMDYVRRNTAANLNVADIAETFGYNPKYLSHLFIRLSGIPLKQYILKCKMDSASMLLTDTNLSVADIARRLGYDDAHNFSRTYKRVTGISPSDYRQTYARRLLYNK